MAMGSIANGKVIYADKCSECHGEELRNTGSAFDLRELRKDDHQRFVTSVLEGKGQMPSWLGVLSQTDIEDLWAYVIDTSK